MRDIPSATRELMREVLTRMPGAVVSHQSAAHIYGLTDAEPEALHIAIPHGSSRYRLPGVVLHQSLVPEATLHQEIPVLALSRTAVVCAADILNPHDAAGLLYRAAFEFGVKADDLLKHAALAPRGGRGAVSRAARELAAGARSVPEGVIWTACWEVGLPVPRLNAHLRSGARTYFADCLFEEQRLVLEIDGQEHHSDADQLARDAERQARIEALGLTVLRFPAARVLYQPATVLSEIMWRLGEFRPLNAWQRRYEGPLIRCGALPERKRARRHRSNSESV